MSTPDKNVQTHLLGARDLRRVAVASDTDPRTVDAFVEGRYVRPGSAARISAAMASLGLSGRVATVNRDEGANAPAEPSNPASPDPFCAAMANQIEECIMSALIGCGAERVRIPFPEADRTLTVRVIADYLTRETHRFDVEMFAGLFASEWVGPGGTLATRDAALQIARGVLRRCFVVWGTR